MFTDDHAHSNVNLDGDVMTDVHRRLAAATTTTTKTMDRCCC